MKRPATIALLLLCTVSCRGVVPSASGPTPAEPTGGSARIATRSHCSGQTRLRTMPRKLSLTLSLSDRGTVEICAANGTGFHVTASPPGIVSVPKFARSAIAVRALHVGKATITMRDAAGHALTATATVNLGRLYVAERYEGGDVKVFNTVNLLEAPQTIGPLQGAEGVALSMDTVDDKLYVSEAFADDVRVYDTSGGCPYQIAATLYGFDLPSGVAVDPIAQMLYVTEAGDVKVFSTANGRYAYVTTLNSAEGVTDPGGLAVDPMAQKLYVAQGSNNVAVFNTADLSAPPFVISGLQQPGGVAIDHAAGKVYITENYVGDVKTYDEATNRFLGTLASNLSFPYGDSDDSTAGELYVVEYGAGDVKAFNTNDPAQAPQTIGGLNYPWAVAVGP